MKKILLLSLTTFSFILICFSLNAQGYIMLAGGNAENEGGWSDEPYQWVVEHAQNKRIAIISYSEQSNWLPNYFISLGATAAKNFHLPNASVANEQVTYDSLITYDGVFLKGGDQSIYYEEYKNTKTTDALQYIYDNGGVLSGTSAGNAILSPIVNTAQGGTVYPGGALIFPYNTSFITLKDDFLNTVSGRYIYDSHFVERARFGRLPAFMANWYKKTQEMATGIGVDDKTSLCIDALGNATVYGTAAVNFFFNKETTLPYDTNNSMLCTQSITFSQLLHHCTINLETEEIEGLTDYVEPAIDEENSRLTILFTGQDEVSDDAYEYFINETGNPQDAILIVTGNDLSLANSAKSKLISSGNAEVFIVQGTEDYIDSQQVYDSIEASEKFMFIGNEYDEFMLFINGGGNGAHLKERMTQYDRVLFFAGDNGRFAGKTVVNRYLSSGTSFNGTLDFDPGMGLLQTTVVMPNAFLDPDMYENTASGVPYAMIKDSLRYGIYLNGNTFAKYSYNSNYEAYIEYLGGNYPVILLENEGTNSGFANQGPGTNSRNVVGFESMNMMFLGESDQFIVGSNVPQTANYQNVKTSIRLYPNPAKDRINIQGINIGYSVEIYDIAGRIIQKQAVSPYEKINIECLKPGIYLFQITEKDQNNMHTQKVCIQ